MPEMLATLNLYTVRVSNVGSFFAAAYDMAQARAIGEQWRHDRGFRDSLPVTVKRYHDSRHVFTFR